MCAKGWGEVRELSRFRGLARGTLPAAAVLLAIPLLAMWHGRVLRERTARWQRQLDAVEWSVRAGEWDEVRSALEESRADWDEARTWLQTAARHDEVELADTLYGRCAALAETGESLLPELAELRRVLDSLADRERLSLGNIF